MDLFITAYLVLHTRAMGSVLTPLLSAATEGGWDQVTFWFACENLGPTPSRVLVIAMKTEIARFIPDYVSTVKQKPNIFGNSTVIRIQKKTLLL